MVDYVHCQTENYFMCTIFFSQLLLRCPFGSVFQIQVEPLILSIIRLEYHVESIYTMFGACFNNNKSSAIK